MSGNLDITGYAIVSDDDKIAGADGLNSDFVAQRKGLGTLPASAGNREPRRICAAQPRARAQCPPERASCRSREAPGLEQRPDGWWWDPRRATWEEPAAQILPNGGVVAVGGGQVVFDLFLMIGFDGFHLSRAHGVKLPGGRSVFSACDAGVPATTVLEQHGLSLSKTMPLDPAHNVEMTIWRRGP